MWNTIKYSEDKWLYRLAAVLSIIIGFVPNLQGDIGGCFIRQNKIKWIDYIHLGSAITFFVLLFGLFQIHKIRTSRNKLCKTSTESSI